MFRDERRNVPLRSHSANGRTKSAAPLPWYEEPGEFEEINEFYQVDSADGGKKIEDALPWYEKPGGFE